MTDPAERERDSGRGVRPLVKRNRSQERERGARLLRVEEGERRPVPGILLEVRIPRVLLVKVRGVGPEVSEKARRGGGDVDRAGEAELREARDVAGVVDVRVSQDHASREPGRRQDGTSFSA